MKIKTEYYGIFYKNRNKWIPYLSDNMELITKESVLDEFPCFKDYLKGVRKQIRKPIKLMRQTWDEIKP